MKMITVQINKRFRQLQRQQIRYEKQWAPRILSAIQADLKPVLDYLTSHSIAETLVLAPSLYRSTNTIKSINKLWIAVGLDSANSEYGNLLALYPEIRQNKSFGFNSIWRGLIQGFFDIISARKITQMTRTEQQRINILLQKAQDQGLDVWDTRRLLLSPDVNDARARLITRTESLGAASFGATVAANQTGLVLIKRWISARRWSTRRLPKDQFDHFNMHMVTVRQDERFLVPSKTGGEFMLYPGDQEGSAGNICNCLCKVIYEAERDASGRLVRLTP